MSWCPKCKQHNPVASFDEEDNQVVCANCGTKLEGAVRQNYNKILPEIKGYLLQFGRPATRTKYKLAASTMCHLEVRMELSKEERQKIESLSGRGRVKKIEVLPVKPTGEWLALSITEAKESHGVGVVVAFGERVPSYIKPGSSVAYCGKLLTMPNLNISMVRYRDIYCVLGKEVGNGAAGISAGPNGRSNQEHGKVDNRLSQGAQVSAAAAAH